MFVKEANEGKATGPARITLLGNREVLTTKCKVEKCCREYFNITTQEINQNYQKHLGQVDVTDIPETLKQRLQVLIQKTISINMKDETKALMTKKTKSQLTSMTAL